MLKLQQEVLATDLLGLEQLQTWFQAQFWHVDQHGYMLVQKVLNACHGCKCAEPCTLWLDRHLQQCVSTMHSGGNCSYQVQSHYFGTMQLASSIFSTALQCCTE